MVKKIGFFIWTHIKVLLWLLLYVGIQGVILAGLVFLHMAHRYRTGQDFPDLGTTEGINELMNPVIQPTIVLSIIPLVLIALAKWKVCKKANIHRMPLEKVFRYLFLGISVDLILTVIVTLLPESISRGYGDYIQTLFGNSFVIDFLSTGIASPITEEIVFRELILGSLSLIHPVYGIIVSSLVFALAHGTPVQVGYAFLMGLVFGYVWVREKNILPSLIMHLAINTTSIILNEMLDMELAILLIMTVITGTIWILVKRKTETKHSLSGAANDKTIG